MLETSERQTTYVPFLEAADCRQSSLPRIYDGGDALDRFRMIQPEPSPLYVMERFGQNSHILVKDETDGPSGSFKLRGAFLAALATRSLHPNRPLVTFSAGNHGRSLAYAARQLGMELTVFTPATAPSAKIEGIQKEGVGLDTTSSTLEMARESAMRHATQNNSIFIDPYNDEQIIAGQGTLAGEIYEQLGADYDYGKVVVIVPVGGGGLAAGVSRELHRLTHGQAKVIGVQVGDADSAFRSFQALPTTSTLSKGEYSLVVQQDKHDFRSEGPTRFSSTASEPLIDGLNVRRVGSRTFTHMARHMHGMIHIPLHCIGEKYAAFADRNHELAVQLGYPPDEVIYAEPAGIAAEAAAEAVALQLGLFRDATVIAVRTGANYDERAVAQLVETYDQKRHRDHADLLGKTACWKAPFQRIAA